MPNFCVQEKISVQKSEMNLDCLKEFLRKHSFLLKPYIDDTFSDKVDKEIENINFLDSAIKAVSGCRFDAIEMDLFIARCSATIADHSFENSVPHFDFIFRQILESFSTKRIDDDVNTCQPNFPVVHNIDENDHDFFHHFASLLRSIRYALVNGQSRSVVACCYSMNLLLSFYIFTAVLQASSPPAKLFVFLPMIKSNRSDVSFFSSRTITMIFQSADLDAAATSCFSSLKNHISSRWRSTFILIEESIEAKFVKKIERLLYQSPEKVSRNTSVTENGEPPSETFYAPEDVKKHINDLKFNYGARLIGQEGKWPNLLCDVSPSALSNESRTHYCPVGYLMRFRTPKEAISLATYFCNYQRFYPGALFEVCVNESPVANLWLNSSSLTWQLVTSLSSVGIQTLFVNTFNDYLLSAMYTNESTCVDYRKTYCLTSPSNIHSCQKMVLKLTPQLSQALKAQQAWTALSFDKIQKKLLDVCTNANIKQVIFKMALKSTFKAFSQLLHCSDSFGLLTRKCGPENNLIVARQWLCPCGPMIFLATGERSFQGSSTDAILQCILQVLLAGNSVVFILSKETCKTDFCASNLVGIAKLQTILPANLITVASFEDISKDELSLALSMVVHPGHVFDLENCLADSGEDSDICEKILLCCSKPGKLFWSFGGELFCN
ncbi:hypothetical protein EG68_09545 [Paragonimus skrjabini miyazakii]|uniref:Uncharacterized protein n=1 Tax=Paragonimus skrjabini miyazakii TaxID=59628 RepID=A0A8S9YHY7_9TREM|nr:hypothetical protein EG68_09545 [Paragonimus skrjabini miyazakii]